MTITSNQLPPNEKDNWGGPQDCKELLIREVNSSILHLQTVQTSKK